MKARVLLKNPVFLSSAGATIEWMEYSAYLYLVPTLSKIFLPESHTSHATLLMFCLLFVTNLARPLGGFIFGFMCDSLGRKSGLLVSVALMAVATTGIGLLPDYETIGLAAPLLLIVFRFMQGLAVGGEFTNAAMFMIEHRPGNPYLAGSWANWGGNLGIAGGALLTAIVNLPGMPAWGWRIPFLFCCISGMLVLVMRRNLMESPQFQKEQAQKLVFLPTLVNIFQSHKYACLKVIGLAALMGGTTYIANMYWNTFVVTNGYFSASTASLIVGLDAIVEFALLPVMAIVAYKTHPLKVMLAGLVLQVAAATANFYFAYLGNLWVSSIGICIMAIGTCAFEAPIFKVVYDLFPRHIRFTAIAGVWGLAQCLISGPSPAIAQWLNQYFPWQGGPICLWVLSLVGVFTLWRIQST